MQLDVSRTYDFCRGGSRCNTLSRIMTSTLASLVRMRRRAWTKESHVWYVGLSRITSLRARFSLTSNCARTCHRAGKDCASDEANQHMFDNLQSRFGPPSDIGQHSQPNIQ